MAMDAFKKKGNDCDILAPAARRARREAIAAIAVQVVIDRTTFGSGISA
jgi:hypothetical protein